MTNLKFKKIIIYLYRGNVLSDDKNIFIKAVNDHVTHVVISSLARRSLIGRAPVISLST